MYLKDYKAVYVMETKNNMVKIGISKNPLKRRKEVEKEYKVEISRISFTSLNNCAYEIESQLHDLFSDFWVRDELFKITYEEAKKRLNNLYYLYCHLEKFHDIPFINEHDNLKVMDIKSSLVEGLYTQIKCEEKKVNIVRKKIG